MYTKWINLRNEVLFDTDPNQFEKRISDVLSRMTVQFNETNVLEKDEIAKLILDIAIDLQSYLPHWNLLNKGSKNKLSEKEIIFQSEKMLDLAEKWGYSHLVASARKEIVSFKNSNLIHLSLEADAGKVNNRWGNDNGLGIMEAMRRGAALVTTNPPIINMAREARPDIFDAVRDQIKKDYQDESLERKISRLTINVVKNNCSALRRIYEITKGQLGYVNFQVNPRNYQDSAKMVEEIKFVYGELTALMGGKPNVVFKVPGTKVSIEAVKAVTKLGIGVNITVNFAVSQCMSFAKAIEEGCADKSYITIMAGRLDDPIADELEKKGLKNAREISRQASRLVTQRVYKDVLLKNKYTRTEILIASLRGSWNFEASFTGHPESRIVISSFPDKAEDFDQSGLVIKPAVDDAVNKSILADLMQSSIFQKAYDFDGLSEEEFESYLPVVQTLTSFIDVYGKLEDYMR